MEVGGDLDLRNTKITELPEGLEVGGDLYLGDSLVTELPEGLKVGGTVSLRRTKVPVRTKEEWAKLRVNAKKFVY